MGNGEQGMGNREWGTGDRERGKGMGNLGVRNRGHKGTGK